MPPAAASQITRPPTNHRAPSSSHRTPWCALLLAPTPLPEGGGTRAGTPGATGMAARLDSLKEIAGTDSAAKLQTILGRNLFDVVQNQIVPGFRAINQAKQRAAGAGATVSGSAFEKLATAPGIGSMVDFIGYEGLAAALAHGAGATGMVRRRDQLERLARLAELPPALMQQTVAKYLRSDPSE